MKITTKAELDALPLRSVVIDVDGEPCAKAGGGWGGRETDWYHPGSEIPIKPMLPATVVYIPREEA